MKASKLVGILLILASLAIGYIGINKISDSTQQINLLGLHIKASDESGQAQGYTYLGVAIVVFAGGIYLLKAKK